MAQRRTITILTLTALTIVGSACSNSSSATPTASHRHIPPTTTAPLTTTSTTAAPSVTPTTIQAPVRQAPGWTQSLTTLPPGGGFTSLSCISDTFCVAAGGGTDGSGTELSSGSGVAVSWDGATWSQPSVYYPAPASGAVSAPILPAIACTAGPSCVIVDASGHTSTGDGTNWSAPSPVGPAPTLPANPADPGAGHLASRTVAVACAAPASCAAVGNTGTATVLKNGVWLPPQAFGAAAGLASSVALYQAGRVGIACPSPSSCTAVVGTAVLNWNGATWSKEVGPWTTSLAPGAVQPTAIGCPTVNLCAIVNGTGLSARTTGRSWSAKQTIDPGGGLDAITCPTATFCMAADAGGSVMTWNGGTWSAPQPVLPAATQYTDIGTSLSCSSAQFCMMMNADGDYATFTGQTPG